MTDNGKITFEASVFKVQSLVDFGIRVTLDLSEDCIPQMAQLMECKRQGIPLMFEVRLPESREKTGNDRQRSRNRPVPTGS